MLYTILYIGTSSVSIWGQSYTGTYIHYVCDHIYIRPLDLNPFSLLWHAGDDMFDDA